MYWCVSFSFILEKRQGIQSKMVYLWVAGLHTSTRNGETYREREGGGREREIERRKKKERQTDKPQQNPQVRK